MMQGITIPYYEEQEGTHQGHDRTNNFLMLLLTHETRKNSLQRLFDFSPLPSLSTSAHASADKCGMPRSNIIS
jgi:hypothetical protein